MSEKNEKRLKAIKTIYGEEAYHKGSKVTYGTTVYVAWWILGYNTIEELEAKGPFIILCQLGKIKNTKGHKDENRNRCRAIC